METKKERTEKILKSSQQQIFKDKVYHEIRTEPTISFPRRTKRKTTNSLGHTRYRKKAYELLLEHPMTPCLVQLQSVMKLLETQSQKLVDTDSQEQKLR